MYWVMAHMRTYWSGRLLANDMTLDIVRFPYLSRN